MKQILFSWLIICGTALVAAAQQNPVTWTWKATHLQGEEYQITFKAKINDGWYTYSQFIGDDGPVPTSINYDSDNQTVVGKATEKTSKPAYKVEGFDKMFDMDIIKYKHDLTIQQTIKVKDASKEVVGYMTYMTCDNEQCRPPTDVEFSFMPSSLIQKTAADPTTDQANAPPVTTEEPTPPTTETTTATETVVEQVPETTTSPTTTVNNEMPVSWLIEFNKINDLEFDMIATATIAEGWYVYSQVLESEDGPLATFVEINKEIEVVTDVETASQPAYKVEGFDKMFEMNVTKYKHDFTITKRLKVTDTTKVIKGFLEYMTCNDEQCRPPTAVEFSYYVNGEPADMAKFEGTVQGDQFNPVRPTLQATNIKPVGACEGTDGNILKADKRVASMGLWAIFLAGFGGGLIALLTPCVFPMIPMTVSLFSKGKDKKKGDGIKNALLFGASIVVIYVSLGLIITAVFGADALNQFSTHWLTNLAFFLLFTVFAISFFGYFEITLPSSWANKANSASMKGGLIGTFFGAFSIALVSFSCTGPIIGTLIVQAINIGYGGPAIGMLGFSLALALPFTLFAAFPSWLQSLPSSGSWMTSMKVVLGFVELALGLKFLSVADLTEGWGILPYEAFVGLWGVIFIAMGLYLFGVIVFPHDAKGAKISNGRKALGVASFGFAVYVLTGFMSNSDDTFVTPNLLSGLAPPVCYSYIKPCDCPATLEECFKDYDEALAYAKKVNKPILIDFTGHGCVNCRRMEDLVWTKPAINDIIRNEYVLVSLYVDDRKKLDKTLIGPDGRKIRNVGNKWALFEEVNFNKQSQPYYALINTKEEVLNRPKAYTPDVEEYKAFLECGVEQFKASMEK